MTNPYADVKAGCTLVDEIEPPGIEKAWRGHVKEKALARGGQLPSR